MVAYDGGVSLLDALLESDRLEEASTSRMRWAKWDALHGKVRALSKGEHVKASPSFSVHRVATGGDRQYRVTMRGATHGPAAGDRHVYVGTPHEAVNAALGEKRPGPTTPPGGRSQTAADRAARKPGEVALKLPGSRGKRSMTRKRREPVPDMHQALRNLTRGVSIAHDDGSALGSLLGS